MSELPFTASKLEIREELRKIYSDAGADSPNVNKAWNLVKQKVPNARRRRVREVLEENEFACRRREPGKRRLPTSSGIATAEPAGSP
jgi:hypothetical protein